MFTLFKRFIREEDGQDFAEYALILGAVGVVAIAVIARYRNELIAAFEAGIRSPAHGARRIDGSLRRKRGRQWRSLR